MGIHPTAIVSPKAKLHESVDVGPYVVIDDNVDIDEGTTIMARAHITGHTHIGKNNRIHMGAVIGHEPQDVAFDRSVRSYVEIGNENEIREHVTIHRGTKAEAKTVIGNNTFLMGHTHFAHDCHIGDGVMVVNNSLIAGYARIDAGTFVSGCVLIHQFVHIGRLVMMGGGARAVKNVPPFTSTLGHNTVEGLNLVGMRRAGFSRDTIREIKECYKKFYLSGLVRKDAIVAMDACDFKSDEAHEFISFIKNSERPIATCEKKGDG